jgi:KaiC/GvpD/RAD55 family RecA-like ATPase
VSRRVNSIEEAIQTARAGHDCMVRCPAHDDGEASLSVSPGRNQPVLLNCHANCTTEAILEAAGLTWDDISKPLEEEQQAAAVDPRDLWTPAGQASDIYSYTDEQGRELFQVLRIPLDGGRKTMRQRVRGADGRWVWSLGDTRRVIFRLPQVLACVTAGQEVYVVEGEKDVLTAIRKGLCATTNPMGAGKWDDDYSALLSGAVVTVVADADDAGREHARQVHESLTAQGCVARIVEAAHGCKDLTDHFEAGHTLDDLVETVPAEAPSRDGRGVDVLDVILRQASEIEYVVPHIFARGDRLVLTGFEGHGKSTFLRQMAVQVAAGINPFTLERMDPKRVLTIDVENHPDQVLTSWQDLVGLAARHDAQIERGMLTILEEWDNDGLDLLTDSGHAYLQERIRAHEPDLVVMGPLTNMAGRDLKDDEVVRKVKKAVNAARAIRGTVFVMEHHAPHKGPGDKERAVRPYGSSMFLKWPDFGYGFKPSNVEGWYEFQRTRFPRVRSRRFPEYMRVGTPNSAEWLWMPAEAAEAEQMGVEVKK